MAEIIPGMSSVNWGGIAGNVIYWVAWGLLGLVLIGLFFVMYYYLTFNIKATVFPIYGSGKDGIFSVGKPKTNRVKAIKRGNMWRSLYPLMNKKNREPFDSEYIYPGKRIYVFDLNGEWMPGRINIDHTENQIRAQINPIPYWVRNWADAESRIVEIENAQTDWWSENKNMVYMLIAVAICCTLCGATVYFTYKFATIGTGSINTLTAALKGVATSGAPPG